MNAFLILVVGMLVIVDLALAGVIGMLDTRVSRLETALRECAESVEWGSHAGVLRRVLALLGKER